MATSVKQHLVSLHSASAAHHEKMSVHHAAVAEHLHNFVKCMGKAATKEEPEAHTHLSKAAKQHEAMSTEHSACALQHHEAAEACSKAAEGELQKVIPDRISRVLPNNPGVTAVPRSGQRAITDVPVEFAKLFAVEDDDRIGA
jgi:hypothetical protein